LPRALRYTAAPMMAPPANSATTRMRMNLELILEAMETSVRNRSARRRRLCLRILAFNVLPIRQFLHQLRKEVLEKLSHQRDKLVLRHAVGPVCELNLAVIGIFFRWPKRQQPHLIGSWCDSSIGYEKVSGEQLQIRLLVTFKPGGAKL